VSLGRRTPPAAAVSYGIGLVGQQVEALRRKKCRKVRENQGIWRETAVFVGV